MSKHLTVSPNEAADRLAIRELVEAYAHCADRRHANGQMSLWITARMDLESRKQWQWLITSSHSAKSGWRVYRKMIKAQSENHGSVDTTQILRTELHMTQRKGGYVYVWGNPVQAGETLREEFEGVVPERAINELERKLDAKCSEWVPTKANIPRA
jgi:hypothetical protein